MAVINKGGISKTGFAEIFWGLMISDAGLQKRKSARKEDSKNKIKKINARFFLTNKHETFCEKISKIFNEMGFSGSIRRHYSGKSMKSWEKKRGRPYESWRYETLVHPYFTDAYDRWYPAGKKIVDRSFVKLTPRMLAYWLMGDGSDTKDHNSQKITFSCESFTKDEQNFLIKKFKEIGIDHVRMEKSKKNYRLCIAVSESVNKFIDLVTPFVTSEYKYKLKKPILIRPSFTRHTTSEIKELQKTDPGKADKLVNEKINEQRKKRYADPKSEIAVRAKERAKKRYNAMSPTEKEEFLKKLRERRKGKN